MHLYDSTQHEARVHARRILRTVATIVLGGGQQFEVRTLDISRGGMGVVVSANPPAGTEFEIQVTLPLKSAGSTNLACRVRVVHSIYGSQEGGFKLGLQFVALDASAEAAIKLYFG